MSFEPDKVQKLNQVEPQRRDQKQTKTLKLSRRAIWLTIVLALLIPFTSYLYTRRWNGLLIFFLVMSCSGAIVSVGARSLEESFKRGITMGALLGSPYAALDNAVAIKRARSKASKE